MSKRKTPYQEMLEGAFWPAFPVVMILGILVADHWPMFFMKYWHWQAGLAAVSILGWKFSNWPTKFKFAVLCVFFISLSRTGWELSRNETILLAQRYYGPIEGRVIDIDQSHSGKIRLTLENAELDGREVHGKVRISLHGPYNSERVRAGAILQTNGFLSPPNGPPEPGGYDFQKQAWLDGIVGVGYSKTPAMLSEVETQGRSEWILDQRRKIATNMREKFGQEVGGFVAAISVGDKSELDAALVANMRDSNLAHLLAISGMHVGTICGLLFFACRRPLGFVPNLGYTYWPKRIAVILAITGVSIYWIFSGMAYSATRAYLMSILFFMALALNRKTISLRSISMVASGILIVDPYALFNIGFQMSFAATVALVVAFEMVPIHNVPLKTFYRWLLILLFTSFIAGTATAPIAAYYFNQVSKYGLLANMLAVPVMSFVVMPSLIAYGLLAPFGLSYLVAWPLGKGIEWIIAVAAYFGAKEGDVWMIGASTSAALVLFYVSSLIYLWFRNKMIWLPVVMLMLSVVFWNAKERPYLLVAESARFFGLKTGEIREFSRDTGHSFIAEIWTKRDGNQFNQEENHLNIENDFAELDLKDDWKMYFTTTKKGLTKLKGRCQEKTLILATQAKYMNGNCVFLNDKRLAVTGGASIDIENGEMKITPFISQTPAPWSRITNKSE